MQFCPSYSLSGASLLLLNVGYLFLVVSNVILSMAIQQWVVSPSINSITGPLPELTQDWGRRLLEGTKNKQTNKKTCVHQDLEEMTSDPTRDTQTCLWVSRSLRWRCWSVVACCRVMGTEYSSALMGPFEEGHHYLHYLHYTLAFNQTIGREHSSAYQNKIQFSPQSISPIRKIS